MIRMTDFFYAMTRGRTDPSRATQDDVANQSYQTRQVGSIENACSDTLSPAAAMADQPGMIAHGGFGQPGGGCAVDTNTDLRWGSPDAWRQKGPKQLWVRPFSTTPNLGGGAPEAVDAESGLIQSMLQRSRKEMSTIMDKTIPNYYQPLIPTKQAEYSNPNNWIYDWTRGGEPTRLIQMKRDA